MLENTNIRQSVLYPFIVEALAATRHSMAPQTQLKIVASVPPLVGTAVSSMSSPAPVQLQAAPVSSPDIRP